MSPSLRPTAVLVRILTAGLLLLAVLAAIGIVIGSLQQLAYPNLTDDEAEIKTAGEGLMVLLMLGHAVASVLLFLVVSVLFCVFFHRSNWNARILGAEGMEFTPGWAVGWFFVPLMNIVQPFKVAREIYQASDPDAGPRDWRQRPVPRTLDLWWSAWLFTHVTGVLAMNAESTPEPSVRALAAWLELASGLLSVAAALLAIFVITAIERHQAEKAVRAAAGTPAVSESA
jgi:hypothetical protein